METNSKTQLTPLFIEAKNPCENVSYDNTIALKKLGWSIVMAGVSSAQNNLKPDLTVNESSTYLVHAPPPSYWPMPNQIVLFDNTQPSSGLYRQGNSGYSIGAISDLTVPSPQVSEENTSCCCGLLDVITNLFSEIF